MGTSISYPYWVDVSSLEKEYPALQGKEYFSKFLGHFCGVCVSFSCSAMPCGARRFDRTSKHSTVGFPEIEIRITSRILWIKTQNPHPLRSVRIENI